MTLDIYPAEMSWGELEKYVSEIQDTQYNKIIENPGITCESISNLFRVGWRVGLSECREGLCLHSTKKIELNKSLIEYQRDEVLFHELVHAHYPMVLNESLLSRTFSEQSIRNGVVEYVARNLRANPEILKHTIKVFGLEPQIYDVSSFIAFSSLNEEMSEKQIPFEFARDHFDYLEKTYLANVMMDGF